MTEVSSEGPGGVPAPGPPDATPPSADKARRQPKAVKPKKMLKMEGHFVVSAACNNGTSALVTRDGELFMFGKDTFNCDQSCGGWIFFLGNHAPFPSWARVLTLWLLPLFKPRPRGGA